MTGRQSVAMSLPAVAAAPDLVIYSAQLIDPDWKSAKVASVGIDKGTIVKNAM